MVEHSQKILASEERAIITTALHASVAHHQATVSDTKHPALDRRLHVSPVKKKLRPLTSGPTEVLGASVV